MRSIRNPLELKYAKTFKPLPKEDGDEFRRNGIFEFNVTKLFAHVKAHPDAFAPEQIMLDTLYVSSDAGLDEETIQRADTKSPILLAEIAPGGFNVIDGNHRVARARRDGMASLPGYRVGPKVHIQFLTSETVYRAYIEYWNGKLR